MTANQAALGSEGGSALQVEGVADLDGQDRCLDDAGLKGSKGKAKAKDTAMDTGGKVEVVRRRRRRKRKLFLQLGKTVSMQSESSGVLVFCCVWYDINMQ